MSALATYAAIMAGCTAIGWGLSRYLGNGQRSADPIRKHPRGMEEAEPYRLTGPILTDCEQVFHRALLSAIPQGHTVFVKVRLAALMQVNYGAGDRSEAHARISNKSLDFLVCDAAFTPRLAICLDEGTDDRNQIRGREFVKRVCEKAGLPIERIPLRAGYTEAEVRALIAPHW